VLHRQGDKQKEQQQQQHGYYTSSLCLDDPRAFFD
jgi:hypothetical protein